VTAVGAATYSTTSWGAGGYQLQLPAGTYDVSISGGAFEGTYAAQVTIADENVMLDANPPGTQVVARQLFYNNSVLDGSNPAANVDDDDAIDPDKSALLAPQTATPDNYTSYWRGINGIMVDIADPDGTPVLSDFGFRSGTNVDPDTWSAAPNPTVTVRAGEGLDGSDRVTLIWADYALTDQWLEVTVKAGGNTGLPADDVFYFGSAVADADGDGHVAGGDYGTLIGQFGQSGGVFAADFNRDTRVDIEDFAILRVSFGNTVSAPNLALSSPPPSSTPAAGEPRNVRRDSPDYAPLITFDRLDPTEAPGLTAITANPAGPVSNATLLYRAATAARDLRTLADDPPADIDTLHISITPADPLESLLHEDSSITG